MMRMSGGIQWVWAWEDTAEISVKHARRVERLKGATYGWGGQNSGRVYSVCGVAGNISR